MTGSPQIQTLPDTSSPPAGWVARHPLPAFFLLAFGGAWLLWLPGLVGVGGGFLLLALGALAPFAAAVLVIRSTGGDLRGWLRGLLVWRVPARFWVFALGAPAALLVVVNAVLALTGTPIDLGLLAQRTPAYLAGFAVVATVGGGLEEPGWRGFALPRLQRRFSPLAATAVLGLAWGVWHVPLYGPLGFVLPAFLAVYYTWLYNRTGSVLLCVLLHGSFTPAIDNLVLTADSLAVDLVILGTVVAGAAVLAVATRGRLGLPRPEPAPLGSPPRQAPGASAGLGGGVA
ncbi:CPBP family intramembrane glutamic endopeptidase [Geodermatophilus sp. SYSU D01036]